MPKTIARGRDDNVNIYGKLEHTASLVDQNLSQTADVTFGSLLVTTDATITGDLTVSGMTTVINTDVLTIKDSIIEINSAETGVGVGFSGLSGLLINRGSLTGYQIVFRESDDSVCIGQVGDLQKIATRQDNPIPNGAMIFNNTLKRLDSVNTFPISLNFGSGEASTDSSSGALRITGGLGMTGNLYTDGRIHLKGTTYGNYIDVNISQEFIVESTNNILLNAVNFVKVPTNVSVSFSDTNHTILGNGTNLYIASSGFVSITPGSGQPLKLSTNSSLEFGASTQKITYNGSNLIIDATLLRINPQVQFFDSTVSSSVSNASVILNGGLSISNTTNASSSTSGGALTVAGGVGVGSRLYVSGLSTFENVDPVFSIYSLGGIKVNKKITIGSTYSANPASFDGVYFQIPQNYFEDNTTVASGIVQKVNFSFYGIPTLAATNASIVTTDCSTLFIEGSPVAGTNQTISNGYSLYINGGITRTNGIVQIKNTTQSTALVVDGGATIGKNAIVYGNFSIGSSMDIVPSQQGIFISTIASSVNDDTTTGIASDVYFNVMEAPTLTATNAITTTNASTFVIKGSPVAGTNQTITNRYSLWIKSGIFRTDGDIINTGIFRVTNTTESSTSSDGSIVVSGGVGVAKKLNVAGISTFENTAESTTATNGSVIIVGGLGVAKQINCGGRSTFNISDYTNSFTTGVGSAFGGNIITNDLGGTVPSISVNLFKSSTLSALALTTTTNSSTVHIEGEPIEGTNQTLTNKYSLYVASGKSRFLGGVSCSSVVDFENNLNVTANLDVNGETFLDKTNINTDDGAFAISGSNGITCSVGSQISIANTSGNVIINSNAGNVNSTAFSQMNLSAPTITTTGSVVNINPTTQFNLSTASTNLVVNLGNATSQINVGGDLNVSGSLLVEGTTTILNSTVITVEDNAMVVNSMPGAISDGGFLVKRYQPPNNTGQGEVVLDAPHETGAFQSHLRLDASASAVVNYYRGYWIRITSGAGNNYVRRIKSSNATRDITLYTTSDNSSTFADGLDLGITTNTGDTYNLYPGAYVGMFFNDTNDEWSIGSVPFDAGAGTFPLRGYRDFHIGHLLVEDGITYNGTGIFNGNMIIDGTQNYSILLRKLADSGDVFYINTNTPSMSISNPVNTVSSSVFINLKGYNSLNAEVLYSQLQSNILVNTNGSHTGSLDINVVRNGSTVSYLTFNGSTQTSSFNSPTTVSILNTTDSTSSDGALKVTGGALISKNLNVGSDLFVNVLGTGTGNSRFSPSTNGGECSLSFYGNTGYTGQIWSIGHYSTGIFAIYNSNTSSNALTISTAGVVTVTGNLAVSGNVTTGTWNATTVSVPYGGTGATSFTSTAVLLGNGTSAIQSGANITYATSTLTLPKIASTDLTDSSSSSTGAVTIVGGVGIAKKLYVGDTINTTGNIGVGTSSTINTITFSGDSTIGLNTTDGTDNGSITICGGAGSADTRGSSIYVCGNESAVGGSILLTCGNNNPNGYLSIVTGNTGRMTVNYNGSVDFIVGTDSSSSTTGAVKIAGGLGVAKRLYVGTDLIVSNNSTLGTVTSGTWNGTTVAVAYGGTGATTFTSTAVLLGNGTSAIQSGSNITYASSTLTLPKIASTDTTASTSYTTGAVTIAGGVGISGDLFSNGNAYYNGNIGIGTFTNVNSPLTLAINSNIGTNTTSSNDTGRLSISGGGVGLSTRGALMTVYGLDHLTSPGDLVLSSANSIGSVGLVTGNTSRITVNTSGVTTFKKTTSGSILSLNLKTFTIALVSGSTTCVVTTTVNHTYSNGNSVTISGATGVTGGPLNGTFTVSNVSSNTFEITVVAEITAYDTNSATVTTTTPSTTVTTTSSHGFITGNQVTILNSATTPSINNTYTITVTSANTFTIPVNLSSITTTGSYISPSSVVFKGAVTIDNDQNATSSTVGGSLTTLGGAGIAQDLYVGGNLFVVGSVPGQVLISSPSITISSETNCGTSSALNAVLRSVLSVKSLALVFRVTPNATNLSCTFEFTLPSLVTNLINPYDIVCSINGYRSDYVAVENAICYGVSGSTRGKIKFTSGNTSIHYLQVVVNYSTS